MAGICHFEIHASAPDAVMAFDGTQIGWRFERFGDSRDLYANNPDHKVPGLFQPGKAAA